MVVYNCDKYIKYAIDSILDQTYKKFELIIINDAGHSMLEKGIQKKLIEYTDEFIKY